MTKNRIAKAKTLAVPDFDLIHDLRLRGSKQHPRRVQQCPCQQARSIELKALPQYLPNFESAPAAKEHDMVDIIVYVMPEIVQMMPRLKFCQSGY